MYNGCLQQTSSTDNIHKHLSTYKSSGNIVACFYLPLTNSCHTNVTEYSIGSFIIMQETPRLKPLASSGTFYWLLYTKGPLWKGEGSSWVIGLVWKRRWMLVVVIWSGYGSWICRTYSTRCQDASWFFQTILSVHKFRVLQFCTKQITIIL